MVLSSIVKVAPEAIIPFSVDEMPDDYKYVPASNEEVITDVDAGSTVKMKFKCDRFDNDFVMECS